MILIGQYDSPFTRRVAIALQFYGIAFEHRPWSVFGDRDKVAAYNPLVRVPTLVLDDGEVLIDSVAILDHLDELAGDAALIPRSGAPRRDALKLVALSMGLADKSIALLYERVLHEAVSADWIARCQAQIGGVLDHLEAQVASRPGPFWFGDGIGHGDIMLACAVRYTREAHAALFADGRWPEVRALAERCEALPVFQAAAQPLLLPS